MNAEPADGDDELSPQPDQSRAAGGGPSHEQQLASFLEAVDGRLWAVDRERRLIAGNAIFQRDLHNIFGRDLRPGESLDDLPLPQEWRDAWRASYERAFAGESFSIERQTAGVTIEYHFVPILTAAGEVSGATVFGRDITAPRSTEAALQATERKLVALFELLPVGISILNAEPRPVYTNPAISQILRLERDALSQQAYRQRRYLRPDGSPMPNEEFASARAFREQRPVADVETGIVTESGEVIWMNVSATPVDFPDWRMVVLTTDITERKRAELALEAERAQLARRVEERTADLSLANAELARAARLKDEFLASMSHELRTPLNAILGRSDAMQEGIYGPVTPDQVAALQGIEEGGRHLLSLINDILDLSKIEAGRLDLATETVEVDLLCTLCTRMVAQGAVAKRLTMVSDSDSRVQTLQADERRLKQILVNLLANAVKFTPAGGKVGLEVRGDPDRQTITFTVWDTGIGIAAEDMPKLFQPFVQIDNSLSRQHTGTGLGLALVARLARAHGGSVAVESAPGQGSRFSVTLPWSQVEEPGWSAPGSAAVDTRNPTIRQALVVEDSPVAAAQIARYLRDLGAQVEVLPHGAGTVERAIALQPDVIVLDILLPDDDGWDLLRRLKAEPRTQAIPVLVVSVVDQPEQARRLGAAALLVKPINRATIEQTLRRILAPGSDPLVQTVLLISPALRRPIVLLAEDNETNIDIITDYLRAKGYDLRVARNGSEAVMHAQEDRPDVILMDIQMPGMDGLEAIRRIRAVAELRQTPIIALTALAMPGDRERCLEAGATGYLAKPVNLRSLVATIQSHLAARA